MAEGGSKSININMDYIKSKIGILRIAEAGIALCGFISESQGAYCKSSSYYSFYNFVVGTTLFLGILIFVFFAFSLDKIITRFNFDLSILINDVIFTILYLIAAILMFVAIGACEYGQLARVVAGLFGVAGAAVVGLLAFDGYKRHKGEAPAPNPA